MCLIRNKFNKQKPLHLVLFSLAIFLFCFGWHTFVFLIFLMGQQFFNFSRIAVPLHAYINQILFTLMEKKEDNFVLGERLLGP